ncbi:group I intron-associated PD-(D/E)XK endonuclease [Niallia sp. Krafla_26]|uniref:group I intron-associated PD-(D/E)XK endonuclease n=1 Tax=Niallia sp. Krafla_26 TaxID=3064703 RepID=UPI003D17A6DD
MENNSTYEVQNAGRLDRLTIGKNTEEYVKIKLAEQGFDLFICTVDRGTDLVILQNDIPLKIQIKTATLSQKEDSGDYLFYIQIRKYNNNEVDFFVIKLNGYDIFYIIPFEVSIKSRYLSFSPFGEKKANNSINYESYRNAFHLLRTPLGEPANH